MRIKFDKDPLAVEQNNCASKIISCVVYLLDSWPRNPTINFKFKDFLSGATSVVKDSDKEKSVYSDYRVILDSADSWRFDNDIAKNVLIFGVDNSSLSHADNHKNKFLVLGEGLTFGINGRFGSPGN